MDSRFALRTSVDPEAVTPDVRRTVRELLKTVPVKSVTTLNDQVDASIVPERLIATLSLWFGVLGALLAAIGLYGLLAYTVARRINEIGIRMALGATRTGATRMVLGQALGMVCIGLAVGAPIVVLEREVCGEPGARVADEKRRPDHCRRRDDAWDRPACGICSRTPRGQSRSHGGAALRVRKSWKLFFRI